MGKNGMVLLVFLFLVLMLVGCQRQPRFPNMVKELGLSQAQAKSLEVLRHQQMQNGRQSMIHIKELHTALDNEFMSQRPNEAKIKKIITEIKSEQVRMMNAHFDGMLATRKVLTSEQFMRMIKKQQSFRKMMSRKFHHKPFFPGPDAMPKGGEGPLPPMMP